MGYSSETNGNQSVGGGDAELPSTMGAGGRRQFQGGIARTIIQVKSLDTALSTGVYGSPARPHFEAVFSLELLVFVALDKGASAVEL
jgi:hypothetical protein